MTKNAAWSSIALAVCIGAVALVTSIGLAGQEPPATAIGLSATTVAPEGTVTATITNGPGTVLDWLGVHGTSDPDTTYQSWRYLSGTKTPPDTPLTAASFSVTMPATPGTYNLRLFENNRFTLRATSAAITVAAVATVSVDTETVAPGGTVTATIANGPGFQLDWLGVHGVGDPDSSYQSWRYLSGTHAPPDTGLAAATFTVTMPTTAGTYNLRLFRNNGSILLATSATITVGALPTVSVNTSSVTPGGVVTATIADGPGFLLDWVGVFAAGDPDASYQSWRYLSGTQTPPGSELTAASFEVTMPATPGTYNLRLFRNNGSTLLGTSVPITVGALPTVSVDTTMVIPGGEVTVTIADGPGFVLDWVGVFTAGDPDSGYQSWRYLTGTQSPPGSPLTATSFTVTMPTTPGPYNLRLFANNGSTKLATSATVTVNAPPTVSVDPAPGRYYAPFLNGAVEPGGAVVVTVDDGPGFLLDWVGVFAAGDPDSAYVTWRYLSGTQSAPGSGLTSATFPLTMPETPGTYNLRLFLSNGSTRLATSAPITVLPVIIPVFQFGIFSDKSLAFHAASNLNFGGRVHTNGNLFLAAGTGWTLTLADSVTAVGEVIRTNIENGYPIDVLYSGTVSVSQYFNSFRNLATNEGSLVGDIGSAQNEPTWTDLSLGTYNGSIRNGRTGARPLTPPLATDGATPIDLIRRGQAADAPAMLQQRYYSMASLRILLSDSAAEITGLPGIAPGAPVQLTGTPFLPTERLSVSQANPVNVSGRSAGPDGVLNTADDTVGVQHNVYRSAPPRTASSRERTALEYGHVREVPDGDDDEKLIGVYRTEDDARAAIERLRDKPGFKELPEGFQCHTHVLNRGGWTERYVSWEQALSGLPKT